MNRILALAVVSLVLLLTLSGEVCAQDYEALAKDVVQELAARQYDKVEARFDARMASVMPVGSRELEVESRKSRVQIEESSFESWTRPQSTPDYSAFRPFDFSALDFSTPQFLDSRLLTSFSRSFAKRSES